MNTRNPDIQFLDWDSSFFGFDVYKISSVSDQEEHIQHCIVDLEKKGAKLAYWFSDVPLASLEKSGGLLVDVKVNFHKEINDTMPCEDVSSFTANEDWKQLIELAYASGEYSRFKIDPNFNNKEFEKMYELWLKRSVSREIADDVLVCRDGDQLQGFVTVADSQNTTRIGLIAVSENSRGKNIGRKLLNAVEGRGKAKGLKTVDVYTQKHNKNACLFYEKCGYHITEETYIYHLWFKNQRRENTVQ